jgi:hypothetical protein
MERLVRDSNIILEEQLSKAVKPGWKVWIPFIILALVLIIYSNW